MQTDIDCPASPGAYLLVIDLDRPLTFPIAGGRIAALPPGRYAYCGSARGPGGLAARVTRHLRHDKPAHWHVDHLTRAGRIVAVGIVPNGRECARCAAHLAAVGPSFLPRAIGLTDALAA